jgi:hypothetical protein
MHNLYMTTALALMAALLYLLYQHDARQGSRRRGNIFSDCSSVLAQPLETREATGFPTLTGNYHGYRVILALQADTLSMRKVPPLWLTITVLGKQRTHGSLDLLVRPQNTEFYSPAWEWDDNLAIPPGWPQHAILKSRGTPAPLDLVENFVPGLFGDEKVKELLITPDAVRITYMAKQANRGEYLLMRTAIFDGLPIPRDTVTTLLESATALRAQLEGALQPW